MSSLNLSGMLNRLFLFSFMKKRGNLQIKIFIYKEKKIDVYISG